MTQEIHDAFQELKGLEEATFSFDRDGVMELMSFLDDAQDESESGTIDIYDPNADTEGDLKDDYAGEVVLKCCICGALIPLSPKEVVIDAATHRANVDLACPCCYNTGGYKIVSELKPKTVNVDADSFDMDDEGGLQIDLDNVNIDDSDAVTESYELLNGTIVKCFSDHDEAEDYANSKGYKLAEYGNLGGGIDGDFAYAYWNETGDRNDDELVIAYYAFDDDGKARPLTKKERDYIAKKQEVEFDDKPLDEDYDKDAGKIAKFIEDAVNGLKNGEATNYRYKLDDRLAIFVGWSEGFDEDDETVIHDEEDPEYGIVAGVKVWTSDDMWTDFDYLNFPYYENGEVLDYMTSDISPNGNYTATANLLISLYDKIKDLNVDKDGRVVEGEISESASKKKTPIKEGVSIISSLDEYKPWSGAVDTFKAIQDADKVDALDQYLEDIYPEGLTVTQLNDILWFDGESVLKDLGIYTEDAIDEAIEEAVDEALNESFSDIDEIESFITSHLEDALDGASVSVDISSEEVEITVENTSRSFSIGEFTIEDSDVEESLEKKPNGAAEAELNERACSGKRAKRGSKEINEHLNGAEVIEFPSGDYLYVIEENGKLIAGNATNTGIFHDYEIDLDGDDVTDSDLQRLYDVIVAEHPEYEEEMSESCKKDKKKSLVEQVVDNAYEVADEIEAQIGDKTSITWDEFDSYYKKACDKVLGKSGVPYDDFETDVRSILSMSGWGTDFEGDNEGGLSGVTEESLTEAKEQEDTWDKVYDAVASVKGVIVKPEYISTNKDDEIVVSKLSAEDLKKVEDAIEAKFADKGVTTRTGKYKFDKKFPDYLAIKVPDEQIIKDIKVKQSKVEKLDESVSNIQITTDDDVTSVDIDKEGGVNVNVMPSTTDEGISEESSDVSVTTESENGDVVFGEVDDSTVAEIEDNSEEDDTSEEGVEEVVDTEETVEEPVDETEEEGTDEIEEIDETEFDELGESYLKSVYDNVKGFRTTAGYINNNRLKLEGIITFNSGKKAKTSFVFEKYTTTSRGKYKLIGENVQLTNRKNAFILTGTINNHKLCLESLTYSYTAKDAKGGKSIRVYGTKKLSENLKNKK